MMRTQVQLDDRQARAVRTIANARRVSFSSVIRDAVDAYLGSHERTERISHALALVGAFHSGESDVSTEHDRHLAESYRA